MPAVMMECGHSTHATTEDGNPVCAICIGIRPGAQTPAANPDLTGREAECTYCKRRVPSRVELAFFQHRPDRETDYHYDGCRGWD